METFGDTSSFESESPAGKTKTKWMFGVLDNFDFTRFEAVQKEIGGNEQWVSGRLLSYLSVNPDLTLSGNVGYALVRSPNTADFDNDGDVDGADMAVWESSFGVGAGADANADGDSDGADFLVWQRQFTGSKPLSAANAVPEPSSLQLVICIVFAGLAIYRRPCA